MTEAILLVGGQGTRLRPLTTTTAKPLLPVAGVPFLAHQLARLRDAGIDHVVLATSYRAETFTHAFGDGAALGLRIDYVVETEPLGTGGAIRHASHSLTGGPQDAVVVLNGDVLSGHDLRGQIEQHLASGADVTLHLVRVDDPRAFGCVPVDEDGRVTAFLEKMPEPVTDTVNAGCYVFRHSVVEEIPDGQVVSVERETFPALLAAGRLVRAWTETAYWLDLGTPAALVRGSADLVLGAIASSALPAPHGPWLALEGAEIAPDAFLHGGSAVGRDAVVGPGSVIEASVLYDGARVGRDCRVTESVIGEGARVGDGCALDNVVLGAGAEVGPGNDLRAGMRVQVDGRIGERSVTFG